MVESALAGVMGHPVSHSLSPALFTSLSDRTGVPLAYKKMDVAPGRLRSIISAFHDVPLFVGWNITIPHKEKIARLLDQVSPEAKAVGAVNVVHFVEGKSIGYNTDVIGVAETLREQQFSARGVEAAVFGAGGGALAVAYVLGQSGARQVWIVNRTLLKAKKAARKLGRAFRGTSFTPLSLSQFHRLPKDIALYVNATPVGMQGFPSESLLPPSADATALAFDLIYRPEDTPFLRAARKSGLRTVGGLDMLIWQALGTWELWFGKIPGKAQLKAELKNDLKNILGTRLK